MNNSFQQESKTSSAPDQTPDQTGDQTEDPTGNPSGQAQPPIPPAIQANARFSDFELPDGLRQAISELGFTSCTPIQTEILPSTLAGRDAFGRAQTGTGKTAAFLISIITHLLSRPIKGERNPGTPRVLILAPTRELVMQVTDEARQLASHCDLNIIPIFGGMDFKAQQNQLKSRPVDIIVGTPGRLLDFSRRRVLRLKNVEILVIDEADRMLDMGFIPDVRKIIYATPQKGNRQTLLFSATLTEAITRLAASWTRDPVHVAIEPEQVAVDSVEQLVYIVTSQDKFALLYNIIVQQDLSRVLVFCNRKDWVKKLADRLNRYGIKCDILTGDVPQEKRTRRLSAFKSGKTRVLVATDVVARGIHIEAMEHVINYNLPHDPEDYVHRIGRTGRAGAVGTSISFADEEDSFYIPEIEAFMGRELPCTEPEDDWLLLPEPPPERKNSKSRKKRPRPRQNREKKANSNS